MAASRQSEKARLATYIALQRVKYASDSSSLADRISSRVRRSTGAKTSTFRAAGHGKRLISRLNSCRRSNQPRSLQSHAALRTRLYREDTGST